MTRTSEQRALPFQQLGLLLESSDAITLIEKRASRRSHANGLPVESVSKFGCPPVLGIELGCTLKNATVAIK
jgi:hypothetical protein